MNLLALTVSVMPFDNRTGDAQYDVMEKGFADMLLTDLSAAEGLTVVERARLNDVITELKLQRSALFDAKTVQQVGKLVGATHLVTGQLLKVAPELRVDVRLVEVATGKVLYGANVAGKTDRIFELEQELVTRFLDGLGNKGVLPSRSGPAKLESLLAYSQALAQADSGDLKAASTKLAAVMKTDSDFRLAKERYADLLKRLREASARRDEVLSSGEAELLARIEAKLASPPDAKNGREAAQYLGYRAMHANFKLMQLRKLLGPPTVPKIAQVNLVRKSQREAVRPLLNAYFVAGVRLIDELERTHEGAATTPDHQRANELGLGDYSDSAYGGWFGCVLLGNFVFLGETRNYAVLRKLAPAPAALEPKLVEPGLKLYERAAALAAAEKHGRLEALSDVALAHGMALLALGRKEEAMARWQGALDELPTSPKYKDIEEHLEKALGVHATWKALDALTGCDRRVESAWGPAGNVLLAYDAEGLFTRAEKLQRWCEKDKPPYPGLPAAGFLSIGYAAGLVGDCPRWARANAAAKRITPDAAFQLEDFAGGCLEWDK